MAESCNPKGAPAAPGIASAQRPPPPPRDRLANRPLQHGRASPALLGVASLLGFSHPNHHTMSSRVTNGANSSALCAPTRKKPVQKAAQAAPKAGMSEALKTYPP